MFISSEKARQMYYYLCTLLSIQPYAISNWFSFVNSGGAMNYLEICSAILIKTNNNRKLVTDISKLRVIKQSAICDSNWFGLITVGVLLLDVALILLYHSTNLTFSWKLHVPRLSLVSHYLSKPGTGPLDPPERRGVIYMINLSKSPQLSVMVLESCWQYKVAGLRP